MAEEWNNPSDDFVKYFTSKVYKGAVTKLRKAQFAPLISKALQEFLDDRINDRLQRAKEQEKPVEAKPREEIVSAEGGEKDHIVTTDEEKEAYFIVRAILCKDLDLTRITLRDRVSYCNVLLDNNGRKPICRFYFNNPQKKQLALFNEEKKEERILIESIADLYKYAAKMKKTVETYGSK